MAAFPFTVAATDGRARTGVLSTARGEIRTPAFMPVGTAATVKAVANRTKSILRADQAMTWAIIAAPPVWPALKGRRSGCFPRRSGMSRC